MLQDINGGAHNKRINGDNKNQSIFAIMWQVWASHQGLMTSFKIKLHKKTHFLRSEKWNKIVLEIIQDQIESIQTYTSHAC